jgi:hypothetical protein
MTGKSAGMSPPLDGGSVDGFAGAGFAGAAHAPASIKVAAAASTQTHTWICLKFIVHPFFKEIIKPYLISEGKSKLE